MSMWLGYQSSPGGLVPVLFSERPVAGRWNARGLVGTAVEVPDDVAARGLSYALAWANRDTTETIGFTDLQE